MLSWKEGRKCFYKRRHVEKEGMRYLSDSEKVSDQWNFVPARLTDY